MLVPIECVRLELRGEDWESIGDVIFSERGWQDVEWNPGMRNGFAAISV